MTDLPDDSNVVALWAKMRAQAAARSKAPSKLQTRRGPAPSECEIEGVTYSSAAAAASALGVSRSDISHYLTVQRKADDIHTGAQDT